MVGARFGGAGRFVAGVAAKAGREEGEIMGCWVRCPRVLCKVGVLTKRRARGVLVFFSPLLV